MGEFEIDIKTESISSTHDGATVMVKYGRILGIICQLCYNHGLHLAITDVLHKKQQPKFCQEDKEITDYDDVSEDIINESVENNNNDLNTNNFEDANIIFDLEENMETIDLTEDFQGVIKNLKRIIRMIKTSSVKKNILQVYLNEQEGKLLHLMLDIITRWNSLITVLKRFLEINDPVDKTITELGQQKRFQRRIYQF